MADKRGHRHPLRLRTSAGLFVDQPWWKRRVPLRYQLRDLPTGVFEGANRYDTDDEHVLHFWRDGKSWDVRWPRTARQALEEVEK
jgi:hypothetical protein